MATTQFDTHKDQGIGNSQMSMGEGGNSSGLGPAPAETPDPDMRADRHRGPFD